MGIDFKFDDPPEHGECVSFLLSVTPDLLNDENRLIAPHGFTLRKLLSFGSVFELRAVPVPDSNTTISVDPYFGTLPWTSDPVLTNTAFTTSSHRGSNPPAQQNPLHHSRRTTSHSGPRSMVPRSRCKVAPPLSPRGAPVPAQARNPNPGSTNRSRHVAAQAQRRRAPQPCGNGCRDGYRHPRLHACCSAPRDPCWNLFRPEIILAAGYSYRA